MELHHSLLSAFIPHAVAVVGASDRPDSRGTYIWNGVMNGRRALEAYPVNPKYKYIGVTPCWPTLASLPTKIDLAVLATPANTILDLIKQCHDKGIRSVLITPSDPQLTNDRIWRREVQATAAQYGIRLIGPDSLGIIRPSIGLNVSFWSHLPQVGNIGFISQSGAIAATVLDHASHSGLGFSSVLSAGQECDVSIAEMIDFLVQDTSTEIIALHIDSLARPRELLSAIQAACRKKPVIVLKASRGPNAARVLTAQLATPVGQSELFESLLTRAGAIHCKTIESFCGTLSMFAPQKNPRQGRLAVLANGIGYSALLADAADAANVTLATFAPKTRQALARLFTTPTPILNPVTIATDAPVEKFTQVLEIVLADTNVDAVVIGLAPSDVMRQPRTPQLIANIAKTSFKPVIINWMTQVIHEGELLGFTRCDLPTLSTPDITMQAFANLVKYETLKERRLSPPTFGSDALPDELSLARNVIKQARDAGQHILSEEQTRQVLAAIGIQSVPCLFANSAESAGIAADRIGYPVAVKVMADGIAHKTDVGGVMLNIATRADVLQAFDEIQKHLQQLAPMAQFRGVYVEKMAHTQRSRELCLQCVSDPALGPAMTFSAGGRTGEIFPQRTMGLIPMIEPQIKQLIQSHPMHIPLGQFRGLPPANQAALVNTMLQLSHLMCEIPAISELRINPLFVDENGAQALDASISLCARPLTPDLDYSHMLICPPPRAQQNNIVSRMGALSVRAMRADDFYPLKALIERLSTQSAYLRFHKKQEEITPNELIDFTQFDRDREAAWVIEDHGKLHAVARISINWDRREAEFGILVEDSFQRAGIGAQLMSIIENEASRRGIRKLMGYVLKGNDAMAALLTRRGYRATDCEDDPNTLIYLLNLERHS